MSAEHGELELPLARSHRVARLAALGEIELDELRIDREGVYASELHSQAADRDVLRVEARSARRVEGVPRKKDPALSADLEVQVAVRGHPPLESSIDLDPEGRERSRSRRRSCCGHP